jgi:hypothetical protein
MEAQNIVHGNMVRDKMTTQNDAKDEHNKDERNNSTSTHDDDNTYVNVHNPYLSYLASKIHY